MQAERCGFVADLLEIILQFLQRLVIVKFFDAKVLADPLGRDLFAQIGAQGFRDFGAFLLGQANVGDDLLQFAEAGCSVALSSGGVKWLIIAAMPRRLAWRLSPMSSTIKG